MEMAGTTLEQIGVRKRSGWWTVAAAMTALAIGPSSILILSFGIYLSAYHGEFGWTAPQIAFGASIISISVMILSPVQGWLVDRFSARRVILTGTPLWALGLAAMSLLPNNLSIYYVACALLPLFGISLWPLSFMRVVATCFDRNLGLALGMTNAGLSIGAILLPLILAPVFVHFGWRASYQMLAVLVVVIVLPFLFLALREGDVAAASSNTKPIGLEFPIAIRDRSFLAMAIAFPMLGVISTGLLVHQVSILGDAGFSVSDAIAIQAAVGVGSIIGRIGFGLWLDHQHVRQVGIVMFAIAFGGCAILASPLAADFGVVAAVLVGMMIGAEFDVLSVIIRRYIGMRSFGRVYGIVFSIFQLGGAAGAAGLALAKQGTGSYSLALWVLCALTVIGGASFLLLGAYRFAALSNSPAGEPQK